MQYTPNYWRIVKVQGSASEKGKDHYRVFGMWSGGYLDSDHWRLNSGITSVTEKDGYYYFQGSSGSEYVCYKSNQGLSSYGAGVISDIIRNNTAKISLLPEDTNPLLLDYS